MQMLYPTSWKEYELIDSGDGEKLERFGNFILIRPEPQAIWRKVLSPHDWKSKCNAHFVREQKDKFRFSDDVKGGWTKQKGMPDDWMVSYQHGKLLLKLKLGLTTFGHVGMFPEQGENWNFIFDTLTRWQLARPKVLNLFAYTGAASVVAAIAGAEVTHVDASRPGLNWANQNMQLNGQKDIRWVYEDALKFVKREARRGNHYHGIIMDPPPYGRGPTGEKWTLQEKLDELVEHTAKLLHEENHFMILSTYAVGLSHLVARNVVQTYFPKRSLESGEFYLKSTHQNDLPMGTFLRLKKD